MLTRSCIGCRAGIPQMSDLDNRYPYPVWIGRCRAPHESRILPRDFGKEPFRSKPVLVVSCINSIELLIAWGCDERLITRRLFASMRLNLPACSFAEAPQWLSLGRLPVPILILFKRALIAEIERYLILQIDPDPGP